MRSRPGVAAGWYLWEVAGGSRGTAGDGMGVHWAAGGEVLADWAVLGGPMKPGGLAGCACSAGVAAGAGVLERALDALVDALVAGRLGSGGSMGELG